MENNTVLAAHEAEAMRQHSIIRWLLIIIVIQFVLFTGSWAGFIWYESQFEEVSVQQEVQQDSESGENNFIGGDYNGYAESTNDSQNP